MKKYKIKKHKQPLKIVYIFFIILVICILMATGYSIYSSKLTISGTAIAKMKEAVITPPDTTTDENGVTRFTANAQFNSPLLGVEMFRVESESYDEATNTITTNLRTLNTSSIFGIPYQASANITLTITNNSGMRFINGTITEIEYTDSKTAFGRRNQTLSAITVENKESVTATISGTMYGAYVTSGTYHKYDIFFEDENGGEHHFYYLLNMLPKV